jgi:hypothetical protein
MPEVQDESTDTRRLGQMTRGLAVRVHREHDGAAGVVPHHDGIVVAARRDTPHRGHAAGVHFGVGNRLGFATAQMHPFQDVAARYDVQVRLRPLPDGREEFGQLLCLHGSHGYSSFTMREWAECLPGRSFECASRFRGTLRAPSRLGWSDCSADRQSARSRDVSPTLFRTRAPRI